MGYDGRVWRRRLRALAIAGVVGFAVVLVRGILRKYDARIYGQVTVGDRSFTVTHCGAGRLPDTGALGLNLLGEHGRRLSAIAGPDERLLVKSLDIPIDANAIRPRDCSEWNLLIEPTESGARVRGHVEATCTFRGKKVAAHVEFDGCKL